MRILIGYDGSSGARAALDDLRRAGLPRISEALVISAGGVATDGPLASHDLVERATTTRRAAAALALIARPHEDAMALAAEGAQLVRLAFPDWDVRAEGLAGDPSRALLERASTWGPDLIVVGSRGRSAIGRLLLGSVSKRLAIDAPGSVRIGRITAENREGAPRRIIVGVDGSRGAEQAVHAVGQRVWPRGIEARLVAVSGGDADSVETLRSSVDRAAEALRRQGLDVTVVLRTGDAGRILVQETLLWDAEAVFVGAAGLMDRTGESNMGSVATHVAIHAPCSVEIVR